MDNNNTTAGTRETLVKDVDQLKKDATKIALDVKAHANAHVEQTKKRVNDTISAAQARVSAHPFAILGIGLALGYVFGARRRSRRV
jgi:ElaB/YqjD/DUF883 family membrane-anchored ribosome-binding protein